MSSCFDRQKHTGCSDALRIGGYCNNTGESGGTARPALKAISCGPSVPGRGRARWMSRDVGTVATRSRGGQRRRGCRTSALRGDQAGCFILVPLLRHHPDKATRGRRAPSRHRREREVKATKRTSLNTLPSKPTATPSFRLHRFIELMRTRLSRSPDPPNKTKDHCDRAIIAKAKISLRGASQSR